MAAEATALAAVGLAGLFEGVAAFNSFAYPVPYYSRKEENTMELLGGWRRLYPPAATMQGSLVSLGALTSGAAAYLNADTEGAAAAFGVAAACQVATFAFTLAFIMPLNHTLLPKGGVEAGNSEGEIRGMLQEWGRKHAVRTALGGVALGGCLWGLKLMLQK